MQTDLFGVNRLVENIGDEGVGVAGIAFIMVVAQREVAEFHLLIPSTEHPFVVGDYKNTASSFVGDFEDFTMQLAVIGDQFCPTVKRIISIALLWVSVPGHG
jgi:hypothetical protein